MPPPTPDAASGEAVRAIYRGASLIADTPPLDPTVALCLGTYDDFREVGVSYERGTPVFCGKAVGTICYVVTEECDAMCKRNTEAGSEEGSYLRLVDLCITQL